MPVAVWLSWCESHIGIFGWVLSLLLAFLLVGAILGVPVCIVGCCIPRLRGNAARLLLCALVVVACLYLGQRLSQPLKRHALQATVARAEPLVAAIRRFEAETGKPPLELTELVPKYLAAIPTPGLNSSPEFYYTRAKRYEYLHDNDWVIKVHPPFSGFNLAAIRYHGEVIYLPKQNYDVLTSDSILERIGTWAYVHE